MSTHKTLGFILYLFSLSYLPSNRGAFAHCAACGSWRACLSAQSIADFLLLPEDPPCGKSEAPPHEKGIKIGTAILCYTLYCEAPRRECSAFSRPIVYWRRGRNRHIQTTITVTVANRVWGSFLFLSFIPRLLFPFPSIRGLSRHIGCAPPAKRDAACGIASKNKRGKKNQTGKVHILDM